MPYSSSAAGVRAYSTLGGTVGWTVRLTTTQVVGGSLGLAALSVLAAGRTDVLLGEGAEVVVATAEGYQLAFRVAAVIAAGALALAALALRTGRQEADVQPGSEV